MEKLSQTRSAWWAKYLFVGAAVLVAWVTSISWPRRAEPMVPVGARKSLPSVVLTQLDGGTWRLADHKGQVVLINYWASWCGPCREETPGLVRLSDEVKGLAVVGISMDEGDKGPVRAFVRQMHVGYPIAFPEAMSQMAAGMVGLPTTVLVDREGRVAKTYVGATREGEFRRDVEELLRESGG
jgi:cytochrome c biogenesis protein CcmG/thiol:disulfide interchange protein DsbE